MVTGAMLKVAYNHISSFYKQNGNQLSQSMMRLANNKRVQQPSDNIPDYFYASRLKQSHSAQQRVQSEMDEALAGTEIAETAGTYVFDDLISAQQLIKSYYDSSTTNEEKESIKTDFSRLIQQVSSVIDNTYLDGKQVFDASGTEPFAQASIDPSNSDEVVSLQFTGSQVPTVNGLTLGTSDYQTESAALQTELNKAASFVSKVSVFRRSLNAFVKINDASMLATESTYTGITSCDTGMEMLSVLNKSMKNQSALSMMAQANMSRASILRLVS
jgi:flagellin-like hook-associated protein FlgL